MCPIPHHSRPGRRLRRGLLWLVGSHMTFGAASQPLAAYDLDPDHTRIHWEVMHFGTSTSRGRFDVIDGALRLDRAGQRGELSVTVGTSSVSTGVAPLDGVLRGEHFFASGTYPQAYFVSRRFRFDGSNVSALDGELTLRDKSLPLTLRALRFACRPHPGHGRDLCGGDFEGELRRGDFGITYGLPLVADRVRLVVQVEAVAR